MGVQTLIFDIGGTVFDWNSAMVEALERLGARGLAGDAERRRFALACRAEFLDLNTAVFRKNVAWMTAEEILAAAIDRACANGALCGIGSEERDALRRSWRNMPAWPGAAEAIARLRRHYRLAPLTILSWPMAVGSSRRSGIDWDGILSCDVLGIYKPDPRCYQRAAEIVDCRAQDIMMVASHPSDLRAAMASGYRAAYVMPRLEDPGDDYTDTGFAEEFDVVARDFTDLAEQLCAPHWRS